MKEGWPAWTTVIYVDRSQELRYHPAMSEMLSSTESTHVDLVALRNWHFKASMDIDRQPEMRRWHAKQAKIIGWKLAQLKGPSMGLAKIAMVEFLADGYRKQLHAHAGALGPFAWDKFCEAARREILRQSENPSTE